MLYNLLLAEQQLHLYDLTFTAHPGKTFVLDVYPYLNKCVGNPVVDYKSKWGSD